MASFAFNAASTGLPSTPVKRILVSVNTTTALSGCSCITVLSPGATVTRSTRTVAFSNSS